MPPPPLLLLGVAQGSLGAGVALLDAPGVALLEDDGSGSPLADELGAGPLAPFSLAPAVGEALPIGSGIEDELGVAADDGELEDDGDALDCKPQSALVTGSDDGDELAAGVALPDGTGNALLDGRSAGLGPPPPSAANAVAANDATTAAVAALNATERRFIRYTSVPNPLPGSV